MEHNGRRVGLPDYTPQNEEFVRDVLALVCAKSDARTGDGAFGELVMRLTFENGEIKQARIVDETILKPRPRKR